MARTIEERDCRLGWCAGSGRDRDRFLAFLGPAGRTSGANPQARHDARQKQLEGGHGPIVGAWTQHHSLSCQRIAFAGFVLVKELSEAMDEVPATSPTLLATTHRPG
jgi:hypothetical protein